MDRVSKGFSLLLVIVLAVSSLIMVESAFAQSIPKPFVPEFTVKYMDDSYDIPAITSVDPFTGKSVTTPAQHIENKTVEIAIKNQLFSDLYYNVRYKGHFGQDWWFPFGSEDNEKCPKKYSNSEYTTIVFTPSESKSLFGNEIYAPSGSQVDFQVKAFVGGMEPIEPTPGIPPIGGSNIFRVQSESE